ncbi:PTS fructose transporter subunit IIB [Desnuesiella massiliensis]|uniref:PTS fructose transporter subunit IIB n=1 Tax=Desnuesiella massiliensis TaxID=1650662 RepID=UPI0006E225A3|nr:PTS fructose transporter subunit IIB [Desnuesiella massiliensis]
MYIVCVTSCPVGIAHTYMAAANLEKAAKARGLEVKVETQGAQGIENEITKEDIKRADGCIIASDIRIKNNERFEPIPTLRISVSEAVKNAKAIIDELMEAIE